MPLLLFVWTWFRREGIRRQSKSPQRCWRWKISPGCWLSDTYLEKLYMHNMTKLQATAYAEDLAQTHAGPVLAASFSVSPSLVQWFVLSWCPPPDSYDSSTPPLPWDSLISEGRGPTVTSDLGSLSLYIIQQLTFELVFTFLIFSPFGVLS